MSRKKQQLYFPLNHNVMLAIQAGHFQFVNITNAEAITHPVKAFKVWLKNIRSINAQYVFIVFSELTCYYVHSCNRTCKGSINSFCYQTIPNSTLSILFQYAYLRDAI